MHSAIQGSTGCLKAVLHLPLSFANVMKPTASLSTIAHLLLQTDTHVFRIYCLEFCPKNLVFFHTNGTPFDQQGVCCVRKQHLLMLSAHFDCAFGVQVSSF